MNASNAEIDFFPDEVVKIKLSLPRLFWYLFSTVHRNKHHPEVVNKMNFLLLLLRMYIYLLPFP